MNPRRLRLIHKALLYALLKADDREVPQWRFDGTPMTKARDIAAAMGISVIEAKERLAAKDVYAGTGSGVVAYGVGTRTQHEGISQRANALAYGHRRRRRHKRRSEK
jgi:hypothetical protein